MQHSFVDVSPDSGIYHHTPSSMARSVFYYMLCAGDFRCDARYGVQRESYNSFLLLYVKGGQGTVINRGKTYAAKAGDTILLDCYGPHTYLATEEWSFQWIHFDGSASRGLFELIHGAHGCVQPPGASRLVSRLMAAMLARLSKWGKLPEAYVSCCIQRMLVEMLSSSRAISDSGLPSGSAIGQAIAYIEANFSDRLSLRDIALHVNMSVFHLARLFKRETGYSPYEYVLKTRVDRAKELLRAREFTVKETCFAAGFRNESSFIATFQKRVGMTPGAFRTSAP